MSKRIHALHQKTKSNYGSLQTVDRQVRSLASCYIQAILTQPHVIDGLHVAIQVDLDIGEVSEDGLRGTVAPRDFVKGDIVAKIPYNCTIDVGPATLTTPVNALQTATQSVSNGNSGCQMCNIFKIQSLLRGLICTGAGNSAIEAAI